MTLTALIPSLRDTLSDPLDRGCRPSTAAAAPGDVELLDVPPAVPFVRA